MRGTITDLDDVDAEILERRITAYEKIDGPRVGDFVRFADGVERRVSHLWVWHDDKDGQRPDGWVDGAQTSDGGSWFLGDGYCSFSGGLFPCVALESLAFTGEHRQGRCWFFHHDHYTAHNGVEVTVTFRVFTCTEPAPR